MIQEGQGSGGNGDDAQSLIYSELTCALSPEPLALLQDPEGIPAEMSESQARGWGWIPSDTMWGWDVGVIRCQGHQEMIHFLSLFHY